MSVLLLIYQLFTRLFGPAIYNIIHDQRLKIGKENHVRLAERKGLTDQLRPNGCMIWFHAASNGEAMVALSVIKALHKQYEHLNFLMTSGTLTSAELIQNHLPSFVIHQFVPSDVPQWIDRFLHHWQPQLLIMVESEIWPNLIIQTARQSIPIVLINGRMTENTFRKWQLLKGVSHVLMSKFNLIVAQSSNHQRRFEALGANSVVELQNIKFLNQPLGYLANDLTDLRHQIADRPLWIAASTHDPEEQGIITAHQIIKRYYPNLLTIIIPRHPQRAVKICDQFDSTQISYVQRSKQHIIGDKTEVYLADTIGELGLFYRLAHIVFLGGSLTNIGGHNVIEPALLDNVIIYGPFMHKQRELTQIFESHDAIIKVTDFEALAQTVIMLMQNLPQCKVFQNKARQVAINQQQIVEDLLIILKPFITSQQP